MSQCSFNWQGILGALEKMQSTPLWCFFHCVVRDGMRTLYVCSDLHLRYCIHLWATHGGVVSYKQAFSNSFNLPTGLHSDLLHPYTTVRTITTRSRPVPESGNKTPKREHGFQYGTGRQSLHLVTPTKKRTLENNALTKKTFIHNPIKRFLFHICLRNNAKEQISGLGRKQ